MIGRTQHAAANYSDEALLLPIVVEDHRPEVGPGLDFDPTDAKMEFGNYLAKIRVE